MIKKIRTVLISKVFQESKNIKTISFNVNSLLKKYSSEYYTPTPGEFLMVWVPGVDEIPISLSNYDESGDWSITIKKVGECTKALFNLQEGDKIGIRGPYGNGFKIPVDCEEKSLIFIFCGCIVIAPLIPLIFKLNKLEKKFIVIEGVKSENEIIFRDYLEEFLIENESLYISTNDGSYGYKGFATNLFNLILEEETKEGNRINHVFSCGPEKMMYELFLICEKKNIPFQTSLERVMRCGFGICGSCVLDPSGIRVCIEGPVFDSKILRTCTDFGKYNRDFSGKKYKI